MAKTNLFLLGTPKSGSTSIANYLGQHPEIFLSGIKEPHFFSDDFPNMMIPKTLDSYLELYASNKGHSYYLDASVWYLYSKNAVARIKDFNKDAKYLVVLRNPIEMVQSLHAQLLYSMDENVDNFENAWNLQETRRNGFQIPKKNRQSEFLQYFDVANYSVQIRNLYSLVDEESVMIIFFDDLKDDAEKCYHKILDFLKLSATDEIDFSEHNRRKRYRNELVANLVHRPSKFTSSTITRLKKVLGIKSQLGILSKIDSLNRKEIKPKEISIELRNELNAAFSDSIDELEGLLKRDLSAWKN